jgi:hypothetical protein
MQDEQRLRELYDAGCAAQDRAYEDADSGVDAAMSSFVAFVRERPERRQAAVALLNGALDAPRCPWEFLCYCYHALRWPELLDHLESKREGWLRDPRSQNIWWHLRSAFEGDWEDAEFYPSLRTYGRN